MSDVNDPLSAQPAAASGPAQPTPPVPQPTVAEVGLDPKVGGLLAYLLFGWIGGLVMYLTQKHPEVRFHGAQSVLAFGSLHFIQIMLAFVLPSFFGFGGWAITGLLSILVSLGAFVLWIFMSIKGYNLEHYKLPIVGDMAEQWAAK